MPSGNLSARAGLRLRLGPSVTAALVLGLGLGVAPGAAWGEVAAAKGAASVLVGQARSAAAGRTKARALSAPPRKVLNMPAGWTWPPSPEMLEEGARCLGRLARLGVQFVPGPERPRITTPVVVPTWDFGGVKLVPLTKRRPLVVDCHLAEALAAAGGPALRQLGVTEIRFTSLYEYRNVKRRRVLSRHAVGLAMDIYEVVTQDGVVRRVPRHYRNADGVLKSVERTLRKTGLFRGPLSPANDPRGHGDHFHLEARTTAERADVPNT
jgi:hypothetical protein